MYKDKNGKCNSGLNSYDFVELVLVLGISNKGNTSRGVYEKIKINCSRLV